MVQVVVVTVFPVVFLAILFGGGARLRRRNIDMDGEPPIERRIFYASKYAILASVLYTLNPVMLLAAVFVVAVHDRIVLAEEQHLQKAFGQEYANYCRRVRRYL